eukprot:363590-Chlamydomonas_euryale.AAC.10
MRCRMRCWAHGCAVGRMDALPGGWMSCLADGWAHARMICGASMHALGAAVAAHVVSRLVLQLVRVLLIRLVERSARCRRAPARARSPRTSRSRRPPATTPTAAAGAAAATATTAAAAATAEHRRSGALPASLLRNITGATLPLGRRRHARLGDGIRRGGGGAAAAASIGAAPALVPHTWHAAKPPLPRVTGGLQAKTAVRRAFLAVTDAREGEGRRGINGGGGGKGGRGRSQ